MVESERHIPTLGPGGRPVAPRRRVGEEAASERRAVLGRRRPIALPLQRLALTLEVARSAPRAAGDLLDLDRKEPREAPGTVASQD